MNKQSASKDTAAVSGYQQTRKGKRPIRVANLLKKAENTMIENDPLIQYLQKTAETDKGKIDSAGRLEDNEDNLPLADQPPPLTAMNPGPTPEMEAAAHNPVTDYFNRYFDSSEGARKKYTDKDHVLPKDLTGVETPKIGDKT
jgi:hypothetical protein